MTRTYKANEVFRPGSFPDHTYIERKYRGGASYESLLYEALDTPGILTSIVGPSKSGKSVLCKKVIGKDRMVELTSGDFKNGDFWSTIALKIGIPLEREQTDSAGSEQQHQGHAGVKPIAGYTYGKKDTTSQAHKEKYLTGKDKVIETFLERDLVLVLEDFHYIDKALRLDIAHQLKDAIGKEVKAVVIALPHRADDAIRQNPDLNGRLSFINIEPWEEEELKQIPLTGFDKLNVNISSEFASYLARESIVSPQLMQYVCLNVARVLKVDEDDQLTHITNKQSLEDAFRKTTLRMDYQEVIEKLRSGLPSRGKSRKGFQLLAGKTVDIYEAIVEAMAEDPPAISITADELKRRVHSILQENASKPESKSIKDALKQMQAILSEGDRVHQVVEWKDEKLHVLDPFFLFCLRWGSR